MLSYFFPWLFSKKVPTLHNGNMRLTKSFGQWELIGRDGTEQGSRYMNALWRKVFRKAMKLGVAPKRSLVLGVAIGGTYHQLSRYWPEVRITGVDWEPELLRLAEEVGAWKADERVETIFGDALDVVPRLNGPYDLIVVDLFNGKLVADAVRDVRLVEACANVLALDGLILINYFLEPKAMQLWDERFCRLADVRYSSNGIAVYRAK